MKTSPTSSSQKFSLCGQQECSTYFLSTPETSQTLVGFGKFTLAKIPTSPSFLIWDPQVFKGGISIWLQTAGPQVRSVAPHTGYVLTIGQMMGWKKFCRQQESKGLNLFSEQSLHHLEETELSVPQSTACLCLPSCIQACVHGGKPQIMTTNNTCERLDVHLHCEALSFGQITQVFLAIPKDTCLKSVLTFLSKLSSFCLQSPSKTEYLILHWSQIHVSWLNLN